MTRSRAQPETILFFGDLHAPFHDKRAWRLVLQVAAALRPRHLVCLGDLCDFYGVSQHDKDALRANQFAWEVAECNKILDALDALPGVQTRRMIEGNHEDRLRRHLMLHPELAGVVSVPQLLRLRERGWEYTPYKRTAKLGKAHLTHDVGAAGRNAVFRMLDTYQHTVVAGHTHRLQYLVEGNALGQPKLAATFGWLGDVEQIDYMHLHKAKKDWALGFGVGTLDPRTGYIYVTPVPIIRYTCCVHGRIYRG